MGLHSYDETGLRLGVQAPPPTLPDRLYAELNPYIAPLCNGGSKGGLECLSTTGCSSMVERLGWVRGCGEYRVSTNPWPKRLEVRFLFPDQVCDVSSVGKSRGLITLWSGVQVPPIAPLLFVFPKLVRLKPDLSRVSVGPKTLLPVLDPRHLARSPLKYEKGRPAIKVLYS